ncbi:DUF21 domain-containing protein At4g14240 [Ziziphus jujuba]|uniref:DUF21 domain-containing protein At4g14240 n=1 Tax=Ziziphus jujuba TaxID=326968 RepID=A0ABM3I924_ZIZJJ|nr:DUF21 domain-containing protein At4g14240 [Ziziphus jujuba]
MCRAEHLLFAGISFSSTGPCTVNPLRVIAYRRKAAPAKHPKPFNYQPLCLPFPFLSLSILDWVLGHNEALFRRAQLKALVSIHCQEAGKGGELTHDETTIISGALDLTEKHWRSK